MNHVRGRIGSGVGHHRSQPILWRQLSRSMRTYHGRLAPVFEARVHDRKPQRRQHRQQNAAGITRRQLRARQQRQRGLGLPRMHVVVRVALKIDQHAVGHHMVGVPGVHHAERFGLAVGGIADELALQTVVLDVVHSLQQHKRNDRLRAEERYYFNSCLRM